jgi:hypothetical protein
MVIKYFRCNRIIVCYIRKNGAKYNVCTGKPSDSECISWSYENLDDAIVTATEFFNNYTNIKC